MRIKTLLISSGDPGGIGTELVIKFFLGFSKNLRKILSPAMKLIIVGNKQVYQWYQKKYNFPFFFVDSSVVFEKGGSTKSIKVEFIDVPFPQFQSSYLGRINSLNGIKSLDILQNCTHKIKKMISLKHNPQNMALITLPVNKQAIAFTEKKFYGHTDFFAAQFNHLRKISMTFFSSAFNLILTTHHIPLKQVVAELTPQNLIRTLQHSLEVKKFLKDKRPILILGINPHAGENGLLGKEEKKIKKIIENKFQKKDFIGPLSADTAFKRVKEKKNNIVIAHYHDQGLIPLKTLAWQQAVNVTWGLPFIRTSVSHGTAFDIAGKNQADPRSLFHTFSLTLNLLKNQDK